MKTHATDSNIGATLALDPLAEAEHFTGQDYREDGHTQILGLALMAQKNALQNFLLEQSDDTNFGTPVGEYLRIARSEGFETVLELPFHSNKWDQDDTLYVLWHPDGILLKFDTFGRSSKEGGGHEATVNGGDFYFNFRIARDESGKPRGDFNSVRASGGIAHQDTNIWVGHCDCREALRFQLRQLRDMGEFVSL